VALQPGDTVCFIVRVQLPGTLPPTFQGTSVRFAYHVDVSCIATLDDRRGSTSSSFGEAEPSLAAEEVRCVSRCPAALRVMRAQPQCPGALRVTGTQPHCSGVRRLMGARHDASLCCKSGRLHDRRMMGASHGASFLSQANPRTPGPPSQRTTLCDRSFSPSTCAWARPRDQSAQCMFR
jgi:hypothetical protein